MLPVQPSPLVPPEAVQALAPLVVQLRLLLSPVWMLLGVSDRLVMVAGGGGALTLTVTELAPEAPPGPEQSSRYWYVPATLMGPTVKPALDVAMDPVQPSPLAPPEAVHEVASVVVH